MDALIEELKNIWSRHQIDYRLETPTDGRYIFRWNRSMRDAGLSEDNVILDFTIDKDLGVIFLGLIRIPPEYRHQGIGTEVVETLKKFANEQHDLILLESASENKPFWQKEQFFSVHFEEYGFWIMAFGDESKQLGKLKWNQMKSSLRCSA